MIIILRILDKGKFPHKKCQWKKNNWKVLGEAKPKGFLRKDKFLRDKRRWGTKEVVNVGDQCVLKSIVIVTIWERNVENFVNVRIVPIDFFIIPL